MRGGNSKDHKEKETWRVSLVDCQTHRIE